MTEYRTAVTSALWAGVLAAFACAADKAGPQADPCNPLNGPHAVQTIERLVLHDDARGKDLDILVRLPKDGGPYPVIIFSHGAGGSKDGFGPLSRFWASHGYVCIHPTHAESVSLSKDENRLQAMRTAINAALKDPKAWQDRVKDISFLIDSLERLPDKAPELKGKLDSRRIGMSGHSFGAYTGQLIAGATVDVPGSEKGKSFRDERVSAACLFSPQGREEGRGLTEKSWAAVTLPMMTVTGSLDRGAGGEDPNWRRDPFERSPAGGKYFVFIEGAHHGSFGGELTEPGPQLRAHRILERAYLNQPGNEGASPGDQKAILGYVESLSLAFWNAYLKDDAKAREFLASDAVARCSNGKVTVERR
jgi:predicted dienelactone hydrolase